MKYSKSNNNKFFNGLRPLVENYFLANKIAKKGTWVLAFKGIILMLLFIISYLSIFRTNASTINLFVAYVLMGLSGVMIVFNIVHDASHMAVSKHKWVNKALCFLGDLVGINTHIWDLRHNIQHHTFTNVLGGDLIIESIPLIRLSPHQPYQNFHKYQRFYAPFLYMLYSFYWMFVIDFKLFIKKDICNLHNIKHSKKQWSILIITKCFYVIYMIIFPWMFTSLSLITVIGYFFIMHMAAGLLLSFVAVMGHFVEGPVFPQAENDIIDNSWSEHELEATIDFAPKSHIVNWITGGLNTHVAHHLFPSICHVHYYDITKIIEEYCYENNYHYQKETFLGGLKSHFRYLKKLSIPSL